MGSIKRKSSTKVKPLSMTIVPPKKKTLQETMIDRWLAYLEPRIPKIDMWDIKHEQS